MLLSQKIEKAAKVLKNGGVVIFPTDTVYGIGCCYNDQKALARIYQIKKRDKTLPLPILVSGKSQVKQISTINLQAEKLMDTYWPGGLTIITRAKSGKKLGFRMPNSKATLSLIEKVGMPVIGTSANFHGKPAVKNYQDLDTSLIELVDYVLKGKCQGGIESTVVDASENKLKIIRQGAVKINLTI